MTLLWEQDLMQLYKGGYTALLGARHPAAVGWPAHEVWPGVWQISARPRRCAAWPDPFHWPARAAPSGERARMRRLMARHGGWAWAESHPRGARMVLAFPRDEAVSRPEAPLRGQGGWLSGHPGSV